jgi:hemerythrin-like domain-containing protein
MNCRCIEILSNEHKTILTIAHILEAMSKQAEALSEYDPIDVEEMLHILRAYGDDVHQAKEEGALFPVFTKRCSSNEYAAVRHMLFEHDQDRSLMTGMEDALGRADAPQFAEYATRLATMLRNHIYKEDNILFEMIANELSPEDDALVMAEFAAFDRDFEPQRQLLLERLRHLEWRYLRKIA